MVGYQKLLVLLDLSDDGAKVAIAVPKASNDTVLHAAHRGVLAVRLR